MDRAEGVRGEATRVRGGASQLRISAARTAAAASGRPANHKLVLRLCGEEGLGLRRRRPRRWVSAARWVKLAAVQQANETRSMDFMSDQL